MLSKKNIIAMAVGAVVTLLVLISLHFINGGSNTMKNASSTIVNTGPVSLVGHWSQSKSGISSIKMDAEISPDGKITITEKMTDTSGVYWLGSFDTTYHETPLFKVISTGDVSAMASDLFASQDASKTFTYDHGDLSFPFSIMGMSTTVHLTRSTA
jgi:hypothetical protein